MTAEFNASPCITHCIDSILYIGGIDLSPVDMGSSGAKISCQSPYSKKKGRRFSAA